MLTSVALGTLAGTGIRMAERWPRLMPLTLSAPPMFHRSADTRSWFAGLLTHVQRIRGKRPAFLSRKPFASGERCRLRPAVAEPDHHIQQSALSGILRHVHDQRRRYHSYLQPGPLHHCRQRELVGGNHQRHRRDLVSNQSRRDPELRNIHRGNQHQLRRMLPPVDRSPVSSSLAIVTG